MAAMGHSGPLLYFMGHLRGASGDEGCVMGSFNAGLGQVRTVRRRDLQDGSCAALPPAPPFALLGLLAFLSFRIFCFVHSSPGFLSSTFDPEAAKSKD